MASKTRRCWHIRSGRVSFSIRFTVCVRSLPADGCSNTSGLSRGRCSSQSISTSTCAMMPCQDASASASMPANEAVYLLHCVLCQAVAGGRSGKTPQRGERDTTRARYPANHSCRLDSTQSTLAWTGLARSFGLCLCCEQLRPSVLDLGLNVRFSTVIGRWIRMACRLFAFPEDDALAAVVFCLFV